jgi:hypothetical protein
MSNTFQCSECGTTVRLPISPSIKTVTCARCGDVSMLTDGVRRRFYPALHMHPMTSLTPGPELLEAVSIWMPTHTRPIIPGIYECRFRTFDEVLPLQWDGMKFVAAGQRVRMHDFLTWRGVLA